MQRIKVVIQIWLTAELVQGVQSVKRTRRNVQEPRGQSKLLAQSVVLRTSGEPRPFDTKHTRKQTSRDPSGLTWNYRGITLLYNFTTALLYMVSSVTMARIVAMLLNIY